MTAAQLAMAALDALEAGDLVVLESILLGALEDVAAPEAEPVTAVPGRRCRACGQRFRWPGELDHHARFAHGIEEAA